MSKFDYATESLAYIAAWKLAATCDMYQLDAAISKWQQLHGHLGIE